MQKVFNVIMRMRERTEKTRQSQKPRTDPPVGKRPAHAYLTEMKPRLPVPTLPQLIFGKMASMVVGVPSRHSYFSKIGF